MDNQLSIALIIISLIGFFVVLALNLFFVYIPVNRIESKFETTIQAVTKIEANIDSVVTRAERIETKIDTLINEFDTFIPLLCVELAKVGITPSFCKSS